MKKKQKNYNQKFKIFGRKKGRKSLQNISTETFDKYLVNLTTDFISKKIILDIGSGNGESTLFLSRKYPNNLIIASEIYQDGNTNLCQELHRNEIDNVKIFNQNVLILFEEFKLDNLIKEIWILFPDPWPKKKHSKRRLINSSFIEKVFYLLEENGKIYIVTDNSSYFIFFVELNTEFSQFRNCEFIGRERSIAYDSIRFSSLYIQNWRCINIYSKIIKYVT